MTAMTTYDGAIGGRLINRIILQDQQGNAVKTIERVSEYPPLYNVFSKDGIRVFWPVSEGPNEYGGKDVIYLERL